MNTKPKKIAVVGLGYVGLPLAVAFAKKKYQVIAFDISDERISQLTEGLDVTHETTQEDLNLSSLDFTSKKEDLHQANIFIITVPTPIDATNRPDISILLAATKTVGEFLKKDDLVIYESTVYPGVTEEECVPVLEKTSGLRYKVDFQVGYSPERINPGDKNHRLESIKKVVSGSSASALEEVASLYASIIDAGIFRCKDIKTAEAAKVIENIQRDLNIALINELSIIFHLLDINTHEVLDAAATKWNFARFEPGLVGGHCIGVDPYYLTHCAEKLGYNPEIILSGRRTNNNIGKYISAEVIKNILNDSLSLDVPIKITILGFTFKENVPDIRNTKVIDIIRELQAFGAEVQVYDPLADPELALHEYGITLCSFEDLSPADAVVLAVKHKVFNEGAWALVQSLLKSEGGLVADLKNCLPSQERPPHIRLWQL